MVCISSRCQALVATAPSTTKPSAVCAMVMPSEERGVALRRRSESANGARPRRRRLANSTRLPAISQTPKPKAIAARVARPSTTVAATMAAITETTKAMRRCSSAGHSSARFQPRKGPTQSAANSGAQIGTKVALKNGGPTETLLPVSRSRKSG